MLRQLIERRFNMRAHSETGPTEVYALALIIDSIDRPTPD
jgi:hypothetical protein